MLAGGVSAIDTTIKPNTLELYCIEHIIQPPKFGKTIKEKLNVAQCKKNNSAKQ